MAKMATLLNVVRYDTYAGLSTGSTNGISVRENPGGKGEIVFTPAVSLSIPRPMSRAPTAGAAITGIS